MKYLLDTHVFLWTLFDDNKLSDKVKNVLTDGNNEIYVSIISYWEISLKYALEKLTLSGISPDDLPGKATETDIVSLNVSEYEVSSFYRLPRTKHIMGLIYMSITEITVSTADNYD